MRCPKCGAMIEDDSKFCVYCGVNLETKEENVNKAGEDGICSSCGRKLMNFEKYCPVCGNLNDNYDENAQPEYKYESNTNNSYNNSIRDENVKFFDYYKRYYKNYVNFTGVSSRKEFWYPVLVNLGISIVISIISSLIPALNYSYAPYPDFPDLVISYSYLAELFSLITFLPSLSNEVRRLRDTGRSGWSILCILIPIAGPIMVLVWLCQDTNSHQR